MASNFDFLAPLFPSLAKFGAQAEHRDIPSVIDYQGKEYPRNAQAEDTKYQFGTWGAYKVPFTFVTNGRPYLEQWKEKSGIWFLDLRDSANTPYALHGWPSPDGLMERLEKDVDAGNQKLQGESYQLCEADNKSGFNKFNSAEELSGNSTNGSGTTRNRPYPRQPPGQAAAGP